MLPVKIVVVVVVITLITILRQFITRHNMAMKHYKRTKQVYN